MPLRAYTTDHFTQQSYSNQKVSKTPMKPGRNVLGAIIKDILYKTLRHIQIYIVNNTNQRRRHPPKTCTIRTICNCIYRSPKTKPKSLNIATLCKSLNCTQKHYRFKIFHRQFLHGLISISCVIWFFRIFIFICIEFNLKF